MAEKVIAIKVDLQGTTAQKKKLVELEKELNDLTQARKQLNKQVGKSKKLTNEQAKQRAALNLKLKQTRSELLKTRQEALGMDSFTTKLGKSFSKLGTAISGAFVGLFAIQKVFEIAQATAQLVQELDTLTVDVQRLGDVSEETARKVSSSILAISSTFEASNKDILTAANAVSSQFGISIEEATEKIKIGFAAGSNASGEFLDILKEYPALLKETGLTADESFALINQTVTQGIYSDKGIDAIKEAGLRLRELTPATREALEGIGLSSQEIEKALTSGSKSVFDVIQDVSREMGKLPAQSTEVGTAIADIFGGPGEDAGLQFLTTLDDIDLSLDNVIDGIDEYGQSQLNLVDAQEDLNGVINDFFGDSSTGWNQIKAAVISFTADGLKRTLEPIAELVNRFKTLFNQSEGFRQVIFGIKSAFSALFKFTRTPLKLIINGIETIVKTFSFLIDGEFKKAGSAFLDGFANSTKIVVDASKEIVNEFVENSEKASKARIKILTDEEKTAQELAKKRIEASKKEAAQKLAAQRKSLELKKAQEKADKKAAKQKEREDARRLKAEKTFLEKIQKLNADSNLLLIDDERKLELAKLKIKKDALVEEAKQKIKSKQDLNQTLSNIDDAFNKKEDAVNKKFDDEQKEKKEAFENEVKSQSLDLAQQTATALIDVSNRRVERQKTLELAALDARLQQGLISQAQFEKEREAIERKAFRRQKRLELAGIAISLAREIASINANAAANPSNAVTFGAAGLSQASVLTGLAVARSAVQAGIIASQSFAEGGYTGSGFGSPDSSGFKQAGVVHEGEYVVPKNVLESQRGSSLVGALEAMRTSRPQPFSNIGFANGGFAGASGVDMSELENRITRAVASSIGAIQVVNNATDTITQAAKVNNIQSEATFG
jgi:hypothetical protein